MAQIDAGRRREDERRARTGLVLGKFLPPHRGHQYLIDTARKRVDRLTVLVATLKHEPIPGKLRFQWMQELYPDLDVHHLTDENPSEPHEHPDFWAIWTRSIRRFLPEGPDVVFTSETYGDRLADCLGARHEQIDLDRSAVPISGTQIREDPYRHWSYLPPPVRAYYARRVVLIGAESTGKTTLAARLAEHYDTVWLPEYGREFVDAKQALPDLDDIPRIAEVHIEREDALARKANRLLLLDTDLITTTIYSDYYLGATPDWVRQASFARHADLYLLTQPDIPWMPDPGQRESPEARVRLHRLFEAEIERRRLPHVRLAGTIEQRMHTAVAAIDRLFTTPTTRTAR